MNKRNRVEDFMRLREFECPEDTHFLTMPQIGQTDLIEFRERLPSARLGNSQIGSCTICDDQGPWG